MKKKLLFLLPATAMVLAGCGNGGGESTSAPTSGDTPTSQTPTSTTPVVKSDMQIAFEAGQALESGKETTNEYTFSGVVTALIGNSFYLQEGDYGMYVYNKPTEGIAVGKTVSVTSKIKNYNNLVETGTASASAVTGDGELPDSVEIESYDSLSAVNQNLLCHTSAVLKEIKTAYVPSSTAGLYTFTIGEDDVTIKVDKYVTHASVASLFVKANIGETFELEGLLTSIFHEDLQMVFASTSTIEMTPRVVTSLAVKTAPTKVDYIAGQSFEPAGLVLTVTYEGGATEDVAYAGNEDLITLTPSGALTAETDHIAISYKGASVNQPITVIEDTLESIVVSGDMTKKSYYKGDDVDASGLVATGHYEHSGNQVITSNVSWVYTEGSIAEAGATSLHVKAVFNTVESAVKEVTGIEVNVKSSLQVAYEAAAALEKSKTTADELTFSGVVSSTIGNSFFLQFDDYGMWVYNYALEGLAIGKWVTVTCKLQNYSNAFETKGTPSAAIIGSTRVAPTATDIESMSAFNTTKQNILANTVVNFVSKPGAWSSSNGPTMNFTLDGDAIKIKFDKFAFNEEAAAIVNNLTAGDKVSLSNVITTVYNTDKQFMVTNALVAEPIALSSINIEDAPTTLEYNIGEAFDPTGLVIRANFADSTSTSVPYAGNEGLFSFEPNGALEATDDHIVITYKGQTVNQNITVNNRELESIEISGDLSEKVYISGTEWSPAGLIATGHYSDSTTADITSKVQWTFDPATPIAGTTEIDVVASYLAIDSSAKHITGINVYNGGKVVYSIKSYVDAHSTMTSGTKVPSIALDEVITASVSPDADNKNTGKIYFNTVYEWRFYNSETGTLILTPASGYEIVSASGMIATSNWGDPSPVNFTVTAGSVTYAPGHNFNVKSLTVVYKVA